MSPVAFASSDVFGGSEGIFFSYLVPRPGRRVNSERGEAVDQKRKKKENQRRGKRETAAGGRVGRSFTLGRRSGDTVPSSQLHLTVPVLFPPCPASGFCIRSIRPIQFHPLSVVSCLQPALGVDFAGRRTRARQRIVGVLLHCSQTVDLISKVSCSGFIFVPC